jgi:hypothetical protein
VANLGSLRCEKLAFNLEFFFGGKENGTSGDKSGYISLKTFDNTTGVVALTEAMRITSTNKVGISTASPAARLHVVNTAVPGFVPSAYATGILEGTEGVLHIGTRDEGSYGAHIILTNADNAQAAGSKNSHWWIHNNPVSASPADGLSFNYFVTDTPTSIGGTGHEKMTLTSDGKLGIGAVSPVSILEVKSNYPIISLTSSNTAAGASIDFRSSTAAIWRIGSNVATSENNNLEMVENGTTRLYLKPGGNVGIGTTTPYAKLDIHGESTFNATTPGQTSFCGLHFSGQSTSDRVAGITWNGGTSDSSTQAGIYVQGSGAYGSKMYFATTNSFATGAQTRMIIDPSGNVGIGTNSPTKKLHVAGDIYVTGTVDGVDVAALNSRVKRGQLTFAAETATLKQTWTHSYGSTTYSIGIGSSSFERHVRWTNKTSTTVDIEIDDIPTEDIIIDLTLVG